MENTQYLLRLLEAETPLAEIEKKLQDRPIGEWRQQLISTYAKRKQLKAQLDSQKASSGTIPGVALIQTQAELDTATATLVALMEELRFQVKNQVRQAELKVTDAQMQLEIARAKLVLFGLDRNEIDLLEDFGDLEKLSELHIKAPFAGTIVEKHAVHSERVTPQFQMFVLADLSSVWITTDIFESDLHLIRNPSNSTIFFRSAIADIAQRKAEIFYTGDLIDKTSRSISLIAQAPNPDRDLKPGMYLEVGFQTGADKPSIFIPIQAVLREAEKAFVFVQKDSEEFWRRDVSLGRTVEDQVEVIHGLQPGERIVTKGGFILKAELFKDQMVGE
jgi:cobalt-zinc-cadmium efflux system membrane fusion protein